MKFYFLLFKFLLIAVLTTGCMKIGPDYTRPEMGIAVPEAFQHMSETPEGSDLIPDRWWEEFNDPDLNRFVEEVLENNLDLERAAAGILELQSYLTQAAADRYPTITIQGQNRKQRQSIATLTGIEFQQKKSTLDVTSLTLPASYELDLWGRLARAEEAARSDLLQAEENRRTIAQSIVSETVGLYLQLESLERRIQITERSIENYKKSLGFVENRYERGLTSILDVYQARRVLAQAEAGLPSLRQDLGTLQQRFTVLLGQYPSTRPARHHSEDYFKQLPSVPAGLPSELLLQRPDIRAAEARLRGLNARIGVAKASRFPRITLTGSFGYSSNELEDLFEPESELWSFAQGIVYPLFNRGKVKAGQRAAEARYQQGVTEYAKTLLTAFYEVENALLSRKELIDRRQRLLRLLKEAKSTLDIAQSRYQRGLVNYLSVLDAQQSLFRSEENLVLADLAILANRVALHRALGGGWADPQPGENKSKKDVLISHK